MITMSLQFRAALISGAVLTLLVMLRQIRKKKVQIDSTIFWIIFAFILVLMAVFPNIVSRFARLLGIISPANLVMAGIILILIIKMFLMTLEISEMKTKLRQLAQTTALKKEIEEFRMQEKDTKDRRSDSPNGYE